MPTGRIKNRLPARKKLPPPSRPTRVKPSDEKGSTSLAGGMSRIVKDADDMSAVRVVFDGHIYISRAALAILCGVRGESRSPRVFPLTEREVDVLRGVAEGQSYKEIAQALKLSVKSVETYRARVARKIGGSTRASLIRYAVRNGLVAP